MTRRLKVFLSYSKQDRSVVHNLYKTLKSEDWIEPWLDEENILPGQDWEMAVEKAVDTSDVVVICISKQSISKEGYVQKEIRYTYDIALEKTDDTIFLIPLRLDNSLVPRRLNRFQWVDYFAQDAHDRLLKSLRARAESLGIPIPKPSDTSVPNEADSINNLTRFLPNLKIPALIFMMGVVGYFLWKGVSSWIGTMPTATNTPAKVLTSTPMFESEAGSTMTGTHGETLVYVPAGEFTMGSDNGTADEQPSHTVYLDSFWIDQTEVTNKQYQNCVDAGVCEPPTSNNSYTHPSYYENPQFDNYPVIYVTWNKANRYCEVWAGGDLPTEAQWEKAARGTDGRTYPWGESIDCNKANYQSSCIGDVTKVGRYKIGKSIYGAYDMAGNVWEWVNDYYQINYYVTLGNNTVNPQGPENGAYRILRGGAWNYSDEGVRSTNRIWSEPSFTFFNLGFRCAHSAE